MTPVIFVAFEFDAHARFEFRDPKGTSPNASLFPGGAKFITTFRHYCRNVIRDQSRKCSNRFLKLNRKLIRPVNPKTRQVRLLSVDQGFCSSNHRIEMAPDAFGVS